MKLPTKDRFFDLFTMAALPLLFLFMVAINVFIIAKQSNKQDACSVACYDHGHSGSELIGDRCFCSTSADENRGLKGEVTEVQISSERID